MARYSWTCIVLLLLLVSLVCSASSGYRSQRVHKSTASVGPQPNTPEQRASRSSLTKERGTPMPVPPSAPTLGSVRASAKSIPKTTVTLRQRVDQAVQKVKVHSKEQKMEYEAKRVERKLRRDQKKLEVPARPADPINPQMPECAAGKVYNGRRCVPVAKMPRH
ncbi:T-DNA border endonuclease VirD2-like [Anopheles cruzii]|uniref:T-DNA border endonuclease VirD2-like n=1 Tax=Anopheles cruzii TaxID=68878 RepID=UPI0022EC91BB|nr:T-DNA border endonuclease VirD2-like [Anopheles cruzii]